MKKFMMIITLALSLVLVLAACSKAVEDNKVPAASGDTMEKDDMTTEDSMMDKEADMTSEDDTMEKEDMTSEDPTDGSMDKADSMDSDTKDKEDNMNSDAMDKETSDATMMNEGEMAPSFTFMTLEGDSVSLADLKGQKVYVKFWASWCPICLGGLDEIDALSQEAEGFKVITVVTPNFRGEKSVEDFKAWFDPMKTPNLTVLLDVDGAFAREFGVRAYPTSAYIGSDSTLIKVAPGHIDNESIIETIGSFY